MFEKYPQMLEFETNNKNRATEDPLVSIVILPYNLSKYVLKTLLSVTV